MKDDNIGGFRKVMKKEIDSIKNEKIFEVILINKKLAYKSLILFI